MGLSVSSIKRVSYLRTSMAIDAVMGNYKTFKDARKEYASLAIKDIETVAKMPAPNLTAPLFSKWGFNMMYVRIREMFRRKTPDEKLLKKMAEEYKIKQKLNIQT